MSRILFVDDEPVISRMFHKLFDSDGCIVDVANDPFAALSLVEQHDYDVVVSDLQMPRMDGVTLLAHVCDRRPGAIRILVTASRDFDSLVKAVNEGEIFRLVTKPWRIEELRFAVKLALDTRALRELKRSAA
jgi:DNA-binding NtrC family response regulator